MIKIIPNIKVPIIKNGSSDIISLLDEFRNKKIILFGIPGAFTPTCSEEHFPGYIKLYNQIIDKGIDSIYCLSVNDKYGIADGNADITKYFNLITDKSKNYMGIRSSRFAMVIENNQVKEIKIENPGELKVSTADNILQNL